MDGCDEFLKKIDHAHLIPLTTSWDESKKKNLHRWLQKELCLQTLKKQQKLLKSKTTLPPFAPYRGPKKERTQLQLGKKLLRQGKVGVILVAGGQGTRLQCMGPKGLVCLGRSQNKSLFQIFAEKVKAASLLYRTPLKIAIMTSEENHEVTCRFFKEKDNFGLLEEQISFFQQKRLPFLDDSGHLFFDLNKDIAQGPDGNGSALHLFYDSGLCEQWQKAGIDHVNFILIDNPLTDPFDPRLIGSQAFRNDEVTIKCILRESVEEKLGVVVLKEKKTTVLEYTEFPPHEWQALDEEGNLRHRVANISLYCFRLSFIAKLVSQVPLKKMPLHLAYKPLKNKTGTDHFWKFERYIFDALPFAKRIHTLIYDRIECYAPLKNLDGPHNLQAVQAALQKADVQIFKKITGKNPPKVPFELDLQFYYPTQALRKKWHNRELPSENYIVA